MWKVAIEFSGRWITWADALAYLGVAEHALKRYVEAGLITARGKGTGYRLDAAHVHAVGALAHALDGLLKAPQPAAPEGDE